MCIIPGSASWPGFVPPFTELRLATSVDHGDARVSNIEIAGILLNYVGEDGCDDKKHRNSSESPELMAAAIRLGEELGIPVIKNTWMAPVAKIAWLKHYET